jgi:hypothetical protein
MKNKLLLLPAIGAAALLVMGAAAVNKTGVFYDLKLGATTNVISDSGAALTRNGVPVGGGSTNLTDSGTNVLAQGGVLASALADRHNALYYGALGTGSGNDYLALQAGLNAVSNLGGGPFYIPAGTYPVTNMLAVAGNINVIGAGVKATTIKEIDGLRTGAATANCTFGLQGVTNSSVSFLTVDHTATTNIMNGIVISNDPSSGAPSFNCSVHDCEVLGKAGHEYLYWVFQSKDCYIYNNVANGNIETDTGSYQQEGIEVYGSENVRVYGNTVYSVENSGWILAGNHNRRLGDVARCHNKPVASNLACWRHKLVCTLK